MINRVNNFLLYDNVAKENISDKYNKFKRKCSTYVINQNDVFVFKTDKGYCYDLCISEKEMNTLEIILKEKFNLEYSKDDINRIIIDANFNLNELKKYDFEDFYNIDFHKYIENAKGMKYFKFLPYEYQELIFFEKFINIDGLIDRVKEMNFIYE